MTQPVFPWPPATYPYPEQPYTQAVSSQSSSFTATPQDGAQLEVPFWWDFGNPQSEKKDGPLVHFTGQVWIITQSNFENLLALQRPVTVTPITPLGPVYIDYWGNDPAGGLVMPSGTYTAILVALKRNKWWPGDIHSADADFLIIR